MKRQIGIRSVLILIAFALVLLMQLNLSSLAQQSELGIVKLEGGTEYEMSNVQPTSVIRVPITIQGGVQTVALKLVDVAIGTRHDQELFNSFAITMESVQPGANQVPAIVVTVRTVGLDQGKYELLIRAQPVGHVTSSTSTTSTDTTPPPIGTPPKPPAPPAQKAKDQFIKLSVILPAAKLQDVGPVVVEQVVPFFGEPETLGGPSLLLWENSGHKTQLYSISAKPLDFPGGGNQPTNAAISFAPPAAVPPGELAHAPITLSGSFPLGSTKGAVVLVSPQLTGAQSISFEIKARRSRGSIVFVLVLGLLAGFVLRPWSKRRLELDEAREKVRNAADTLDQELQRRPDAEFQQRVGQALIALRQVVASSKVEALAAGVTAASTALANAMTDLDNRRVLVKDQQAAFTRLTHTDWLLPAEVADAFKIDEQELAKAGLEVESENILSAKVRFDRLSANLGGALGPAVSRWRSHTKSFLDALSAIAVLISSKGNERLTQETTAINEKLDAMQAVDGGATVEQIIVMLTGLRDARSRIDDLLSILHIALKSTSEILREQFDQVALPDEARFKELVLTLDQLEKDLPDLAARPETGAITLPARVAGITALWRDVMLEQVAGRPEAQKQVNELCDQKDFLGAAAAVVAILKTAVNTEEGAVVEEALAANAGKLVTVAPTTFGAGSLFDGLLSMLSGKPGAEDAAIPRTPRETTRLPQLEALRVRSLLELLLVKGLRFAISSLVILVVGYALFADKFVGTLSDLLAVFFWGFGIDIGVDAVAEVG